MNCEQLLTCLSDYIDRELPEGLTAEAEAHLQTCRNCRIVLDTTRRTITLLSEDGEARVIPAERRKVLYEQLRVALARRD